MSRIIVQLLSGFSVFVESPERRVALPPRAAKLLAYFLFHRNCWLSREALTEQFWPDKPLEQARSSLNSTLSRLRKAFPPKLGPIVVPMGREALALEANLELHVDVDAFTAGIPIDQQHDDLIDVAQLKNALSLYRDELLAGWYDDWVLIERERLRHMYIVGLGHLMAHSEKRGAYEQAIAYGHQLLGLEPLRESAHRSMMRLYMRLGDRAAALRQYAACRALLEAELDVSPMLETQELYGLILPADHPHRAQIVNGPNSLGSNEI